MEKPVRALLHDLGSKRPPAAVGDHKARRNTSDKGNRDHHTVEEQCVDTPPTLCLGVSSVPDFVGAHIETALER